MKNNNSYFTGIICALIGGLIATIPWILTYVYANMILSVLAVIIALCAYKGYQLGKGKMSSKVPIIISIISIISVTVATLVIIPLLLLNKEGLQVSLDNLGSLYNSDKFMTALFKDYVISIIFTILGISGIISKVKGDVEDLVD